MPTSDDPGFSISLNLSHKQFQTEAWAQQIFQLLERTGIPGACLEVELTEQGGIEEGLWVESAFEHLRAQGVAISLDDFPEGGSSLLRLARFKFDKVKIDRCMVPAMGESQEVWRKKREILSDLVDLIRDTGAEAVVEGVERVEQHNFLACLPIREWQGFLWGGAVPLDALAPRLRCLGAP
jgi:EAL domain-containing protein (putative c-di-GMP-specific phosphodiesterase class I)